MRIQQETSETLRELAGASGRSMQDVLADAVEAYRRRDLLERTNEAYAALRSDARRWREELAERADWEVTLADGLEGP